MEEIQFALDSAAESMQKTVDHTGLEFGKVRAGKANPGIVSGLQVEYYGAMTPLSQVASVNTADARTLVIKPWEKPVLQAIEKAIINSDLGLNPQNDGDIIRLNIPPLTEERRRDLMKQIKGLAENGKVSIRSIRKETNKDLQQLQKDGASEDVIKSAEEDVQKMTDQYSKAIDALTDTKEKEVMTI